MLSPTDCVSQLASVTFRWIVLNYIVWYGEILGLGEGRSECSVGRRIEEGASCLAARWTGEGAGEVLNDFAWENKRHQ